MSEQFENYKLLCMHQQDSYKKLMREFCMDNKLNTEIRKLRKGINKLQKMQNELSDCQKPDDIEELPFNNTSNDDISSVELDDELKGQQEKVELQVLDQKELKLSCGLTPCLFEHCRRRVDSQLLLLHYLTNHSDGDAAFLRCHKIGNSQQIVLSFTARRCELNQNQVIGLLNYGDSQLEHKQLNIDGKVPIVVLICRTSVNSLCLANPKDQVFVIWLVTPHTQSELHATLCLCGRNAAVQAKTILTVRPLSERGKKDTSEFMTVDDNYWILSYNEMRKISNEFRDELHLTVGINE